MSTVVNHLRNCLQVFELGKYKPDAVLEKMWDNFAADGSEDALRMQRRLRIIAAGGDGTVAWVLQVIARGKIQPAPPVAIMPLGTGNDMARSFGWGAGYSKKSVSGHVPLFNTLREIAKATPSPLDCWKLSITCPSAECFRHQMPYAFIPEGGTLEVHISGYPIRCCPRP